MSRQPWTDLALPPELLAIPAMLSKEEKQYLAWLTSEVYQGWGAIIDLGCWLGSSSAALAHGLKLTGRTAVVHSLDLFEWRLQYMERIHPAGLTDGADFQHLFRQFTAEYCDMLDVHKVDLTRYDWNSGPIELLFVDAAKTLELTNKILQSFGHSLVPGRTRIIFQDFRHFSANWLPLITDSRPDFWKEMECVDNGWTVTFTTCKDLVGTEGLPLPYTADSFSFDSAAEIFRRRIANSEPPARHYYELGLYSIALCDGRVDVAEEMKAAAQPHVYNFDRIFTMIQQKAAAQQGADTRTARY